MRGSVRLFHLLIGIVFISAGDRVTFAPNFITYHLFYFKLNIFF